MYIYRGKITSAVRRALKGRSAMSSAQQSTILEQRNILGEKIRAWIHLRTVYIPGLLQLLVDLKDTNPSEPDEKPEGFKLWLPSEIPPTRRRAACIEGLPEIESKLRTAQCNDALDDVRHTMRVKARMVQFKNQNVRGQREGIRSRAVVDRVHEKATAAVQRYRTAREAKMNLDGPGDWEIGLKVLKDEDVRSYKDPQRAKSGGGRAGTNEDTVNGIPVIYRVSEAATTEVEPEEDLLEPAERSSRSGTGETRKQISWIWTSSRSLNIDDNTDEDDQVLRAEWCRSRARGKRAGEEVLKLQEEMNRTLRFLEWKSEWWLQCAASRTASSDIAEGLAAYAKEQSQLQLSLRAEFRRLWGRPLTEELFVPLFPDVDDDEGNDEDSDDEDPENKREGHLDADDYESEDE